MSESSDTALLKAANNVLLLLVSRIAMIATPFVATLLVYLGSFWLTSQFAASNIELSTLTSKVDNYQNQVTAQAVTIADLKSELALTTQSTQLAAQSLASWEGATGARLDKMTDAVNSLASSVAALNATVTAQSKGN